MGTTPKKRGILDAMATCKKIEQPTSIVLLGATGDLAQKKLLSSLMDLYGRNVLPDRFYILGFSRDAHTNQTKRTLLRSFL